MRQQRDLLHRQSTDALDQRGVTAVIPAKANCEIQRDYNIDVYKWRHLVANHIAKIKEQRAKSTEG